MCTVKACSQDRKAQDKGPQSVFTSQSERSTHTSVQSWKQAHRCTVVRSVTAQFLLPGDRSREGQADKQKHSLSHTHEDPRKNGLLRTVSSPNGIKMFEDHNRHIILCQMSQ